MALIYGYLFAWVAGGVLLASAWLLERAPGRPPPWFSLLWLGLLSFGGLGLVLEALALARPELRPLCAAAGGLALTALGWALLRRPA